MSAAQAGFRARALACGAAVVAALAPGLAGGTTEGDQPRVLAAWSQVFGTEDPQRATGRFAPRLEMRFVLEAHQDCGAFGVEYRLAADGAWQAVDPAHRAQARRVASGTPAPLAVTVCALPMQTRGEDWYVARLRWGDTDAVLSSHFVAGDTEETVGSAFRPGPADGLPISLWGGASIGTRNALAGRDRIVLVTLGDTGCRGKPHGWNKPQRTPADEARLQRMTQSCDSDSWPLARLAAEAAVAAGPGHGPDLVIHVGDYRYFLEDQVPKPANGWLYWQKDFFPAAQPLLLAAPWVAVRGNHEACGEWGFGDSYLQLFGPGGWTSCAGAPDPLPAYAFDIAAGGLVWGAGAAHRFVVLDTNQDPASGATGSYPAAMQLTRASAAPTSTWWVTHVPAITLVDFGEPAKEYTGDPELQAALIAAAGGNLSDWFCPAGSCRPSQILLGHQHLYQSLEFPADGRPGGHWVLPRHVVVGHGGTAIDSASPAPPGVARCRYRGFAALGAPGRDAPIAIAETQALHGVVAWVRDADTLALPAGWDVLRFIWAGGAPVPADASDPTACRR